jgi:predicted phage-related endonuclease
MNDTSPAIEAFLRTRYAAMTGSERAMMALQMFETAQLVVLSSLDPDLSADQRRRELCRRFYGDEVAHVAFPKAE